MSNDPITISWDELGTRKVDQRLREEQALSRNRAYAQLDDTQVQDAGRVRFSLMHNTIFFMAVLGIVGGMLAWGCGLMTQFKSAEQRASDLLRGMRRIEFQRDQHMINDADAALALAAVRQEGQRNPYFTILSDPHLSFEQQTQRLNQVGHRASLKRFALNVVSFGLSGMLLALCLGIAEPLTERNMPALVRNGALGAGLGLLGGVVVSLFVDRLYQAAAGSHTGDTTNFTFRDIIARMLAWGVLGLFLTIGPGVLLRNPRKLLIGAAGGLIGGMLGGMLFDPIGYLVSAQASRLIALMAIGGLAGVATGLIEDVAKTGWIRVTRGFIAGKQFILYRNPTYIGSAPDSQIYLFRDPQVGRRHAALHLVAGGVDLEDLPLGSDTRVNGRPVTRVRLRNGDQIEIGSSTFLFQEKLRKQKDDSGGLVGRMLAKARGHSG
jgi:hypothetical protein